MEHGGKRVENGGYLTFQCFPKIDKDREIDI